jgi:hypothetical protein
MFNHVHIWGYPYFSMEAYGNVHWIHKLLIIKNVKILVCGKNGLSKGQK